MGEKGEKEWEEMDKEERLSYLKELDEHPNQWKESFENVNYEDSSASRTLYYRLYILAKFKPQLNLIQELEYLREAKRRTQAIIKNKYDFHSYILDGIKSSYSSFDNKNELIYGQLNIIFNELLSKDNDASDMIIPHLENYDFILSPDNVFYSFEAKKGFDFLLENIDKKNGLKTKHFKVLWFEYGPSSNRLMIKSTRKEFMRYVYDNYLQGQKEVDFTNNRPEGILADQLKTLFKRRELSYENKDIYKKEF